MQNKICLFILCFMAIFSSSASRIKRITVPVIITDTNINVAFSPNGAAETLIINTLDSAKKSIRLAAYAFTSSSIANSLVRAKKRGVDVAIIVDFKQIIKADLKGKGKAALDLLAMANIPIHTVNTRSTQHNKYMVIDERHVQTGSYNYTTAARYNSENVMLIKNNRKIAKAYLKYWQQLSLTGEVYKTYH